MNTPHSPQGFPEPAWYKGTIRAFVAHGCSPREIQELFAASGLTVTIATIKQYTPLASSRALAGKPEDIEALRAELLEHRRQVGESITATSAMLTEYTAMDAVFADALEALRDGDFSLHS